MEAFLESWEIVAKDIHGKKQVKRQFIGTPLTQKEHTTQCWICEGLFECEEVFLYILKLKPSSTYSYEVFLRLALTYLHRKSWEDAKATFNKAVELKPSSSVAWLGLGIANLRLDLLK